MTFLGWCMRSSHVITGFVGMTGSLTYFGLIAAACAIYPELSGLCSAAAAGCAATIWIAAVDRELRHQRFMFLLALTEQEKVE